VNLALWIAQILLAIAFGMAGIMKATQPKEKLAANMGWVDDFSAKMVKVIGTAEILGAVGLILPWATGILTWLTPVAAVGLAVIQVGAIVTHLRRKEPQVLVANVILLALAVFVAVGRF
jgi:uncharacterized membrane protein YphA (DoxX/SURF4 family)